MKIAAFCIVDYFDSNMRQVIVQTKDDAIWKHVYFKAVKAGMFDDCSAKVSKKREEWILSLPDDYEEARKAFHEVNGDMIVSWLKL